MRVAILGARGIPNHYGGWDAVATELAPRLVTRGADVTVYCQTRYSLPNRPREWRGARLVYLPAIQKRALESASHETLSMLHTLFGRFDVVYVLGMRATVVYTVTAKTRSTLFFNTDGHDHRRRKWSPNARRYLEWSERFGVRLRPQGLISDSAAIAEYFYDRYGVRPTFIPYGAPTLPTPDAEPVMRRGLEPGKYLLVICRIEPENNVDKAIDAFQRVDTDMPLVVVGGTNYASEYARRIEQSASSSVRLAGWVFDPDEVNSLFQHSYAYIHGHEVGGTNPSLLHAMAAASCVLANDVVYNREVLGPAGLYWNSVPALAEQIRTVIADPALPAALGEQAEHRVRTLYDWDDVADRSFEVFRRAVDTASSRRR